MKNIIFALLAALWLTALLPATAQAAFPDDFSDVTWIDPNVSSWAQTSTISVDVIGTRLIVPDSKRSVWPARYHSVLRNSCCNRSLWIFIKYQGSWYATTFEYMRFGQIEKSTLAIVGGHMKRPPFLTGGFNWKPAQGEVYGFMTSGMARFDLNNVNVQERSNVALYRWQEGPTNNINFEEVPRDSSGVPVASGSVQEPVCVEPPAPTPVVNTHLYNGDATGSLVITGATNQTAAYNESVSVLVSDDRSLTFTLDDESFATQVGSDGSFEGQFTLDIGNAGVCIVDIDVNGVINGTAATGTASGSDACAGNTATFNATFSAVSPTAPSYLDERDQLPTPPSVCNAPPNLSALIDLLLLN